MPRTRLTADDLALDPRYAIFPPTKFCSACKETKAKFDFHVHAAPVPKRGGSPYRMASWCKPCVLERQKVRRAKGSVHFVPVAEVQDKLHALYGKTESLHQLSKITGLSFSSVTMMFERTKVGAVNATVIQDTFACEFAGVSDEGIEHFRERGRARHAASVEKRSLRRSDDPEAGLRTCIKCTKRKFTEEFPSKVRREAGRKVRRYVSHVCVECDRFLRREREGIDHGQRLVLVTPTLVSITERVVAHYRRKDLDERKVWDTLTRGITTGRTQKVRASSAEKILLAARDMHQ